LARRWFEHKVYEELKEGAQQDERSSRLKQKLRERRPKNGNGRRFKAIPVLRNSD
jgi:hypothetical protein